MWTNILSKSCFQFFFGYIPRSGITRSYRNTILFFEELPYCFPKQLCHFSSPPAVHKSSNFSTSLSSLVIFWFCFFWGGTPEAHEGSACDLHHSSQQCHILNPLSEARDQSCILMDTSQYGNSPLSWVDLKLPSLAPPPGRAEEFSCPYVVKLGPSWHLGNEQKGGNIY